MFSLGSTEMKLVLIACVLFIIKWIRWRRKKLKIFEDLGIPGPSPNFLFGNLLEMISKGQLRCQQEWVKQYGPSVGYFHGLQPVLMVTDSHILKRIFIKDFHLFSERPDVVPLRVHSFLDDIIPATKIMDTILLNQKGEQWKRVRSKLSPIFSANKLKMVIPFVNKVTDVTASVLEKKARDGNVTDVYSLMQYLTLDVISAQAFAAHTNVQEEGDKNNLYRSAKTIFDNPISSKILIFGMCFPEVGFFGMALNFLKMFFTNGFTIPPLEIANVIGKVVETRRKHPETRKPDLLQCLIDASEPEKGDITEAEREAQNIDPEGTSSRNPSEKLTELEIISNALVVFLAGYETTSCALSCTLHMLAKHPEFQKKIQEEIDQLVGDKDVDYYTLNRLQRLERFILESLRFYPPGANFVLRLSLQDVDFGHFHVPKGMLITVPVNYMHFSEEFWENPDVFDPDRFLPERRTENHLTNYWVFGIGPRNCLGIRLATITSKVILTKLLRRFTFELPNNSDEAKVSMVEKCGTMVPVKVIVKIKERITEKKKDATHF